MKKRTLVAAAAVAAIGALTGAATRSTAAADAPKLQRFSSCDDYLGYVKPFARPPDPLVPVPAVAAPPVPPPVSARAGGGASGTNVQEIGVDEPDIVKANRSRLFAISGERLVAVDLRRGKPRYAGSLRLDPGTKHQLLLDRTRVYVLSVRSAEVGAPPGSLADQTVLTEIDARNPGAMQVVGRMTIDGFYVSAREIGHTMRVVLTSTIPHDLQFVTPTDWTLEAYAKAAAANRAIFDASGPENWLPHYVLERRAGTTAGSLLRCDQVARPPAFSGLSMLTVLTIDLRRGLQPTDADGVLSNSQTAYASPTALYVATAAQPIPPIPAVGGGLAPPPTTVPSMSPRTALHKFDTAQADQTDYRASGEVPGLVRDQWSLSEHRGVLRVASTQNNRSGGDETIVTTLGDKEGSLVKLGRVGGLGRGEPVYAVRFIDDAGYVVTFRQTDPLYTLDLARPTRPQLLGHLDLLGWSAYLHPLGGGLLLGVGQNADPLGRAFGTQLSVFDVADLRHPARLAGRTVPGARSEVEADHHAFLYWPATHLVVIPVAKSTRDAFAGVIAYRLAGSQLDEVPKARGSAGLTRVGRLVQWSDGRRVPVRRSLVVGGTLYTVSEAGVRANDVANLQPRGWAGFDEAPELRARHAASPD